MSNVVASLPAALLLVLLHAATPAAAQRASLAGFVRDSAGVGIPAAVVSLAPPGAIAGTPASRTVATDDRGRFFLELDAGTWRLRAGRLGYVDTTLVFALAAGERRVLAITLEELPVALDPVMVERMRERERFEGEAGMSARVLTAEQLGSLPGLAEPDVLRAIEVLPGVVSTSDFSSAFNVRGGAADQNLILLDGIPIYNPFHLGGLFSVFNSDMIARAELMAGGFPARYGGRVSSVLDVESDAGDAGLEVDGGLSLLAARIAVGDDAPAWLRAPVGASTGRWRVAARRSYFDRLLQPVFDFPYHLTDLQGVVELRSPGGDRLALTAYTGTDLLDLRRLEDSFPLRIRWDWGNDLIGGRWTRPLGGAAALDVRVSHTRFGTSLRFPDFADTEFRSDIAQSGARADLRLRPSGAVDIGIGGGLERIGYANRVASGGTVFREEGSDGWLPAVYGQLGVRSGRWLLEAGVRGEGWLVDRESDAAHLAPRVALKRFIGDDLAARIAAGRYVQYVHSVRNEELPFGIDIWVTAGDRAPAVVSDQIQGGLERFFDDDRWFASIEAYHRRFDGLIAFNFADDPDRDDDDFVVGSGESYGTDLLVRRDGGRGPRGWIAVSWLRTRRSLPDPTVPTEPGAPTPIVEYPPVYDRRLDIDLVLSQELGDGWQAGARFNYGSGLPYTRAVGSYAYYDLVLAHGVGLRPGETPGTDEGERVRAVLLGPRNAERYPAYHRLDVSVRRTWQLAWGRLTPYAQVINLYDRRNVLFYFYQMDRDPPTRTGLSMMPVLPTLGVEASF